MKNPLILAISAVAVVTVLASPRLGFSANCTAPVISRPPNQAASYEPQFRYSPGDNLRLTDNLGETSFPEPAAPAAAVPEAPKNFRAVSYSGETTNLNWDAPETQPDRWLIRYRPIGGSWINAGTTSLNNYYTVTGLSASTSYDFIVYAENGSTAWSGTRSAGSSHDTAHNAGKSPSTRLHRNECPRHMGDRHSARCGPLADQMQYRRQKLVQFGDFNSQRVCCKQSRPEFNIRLPCVQRKRSYRVERCKISGQQQTFGSRASRSTCKH